MLVRNAQVFFDRLPRVSREQARIESVLARWIATSSSALPRTAKLLGVDGTSIRARVVAPSEAFDPHAAACIVKAGGVAIEVRGSSLGVRAIAQAVVGGPAELGAPRPLSVVEESAWCLAVATALEDLGVPGIVWPRPTSARTSSSHRVELEVTWAETSLAIQLHLPADLELRVPPRRERAPRWAETATLEVPIVVGRCAVHREDLARLRVRSLVTIEPAGRVRFPKVGGPAPVIETAELEVLGGGVGVRPTGTAAGSSPQPVVAEVVTGYLRRDMTLPDDAHVELTVAVGTTRMTLRQVFDLAVGQIITLGRPLAGPFELRAAGKKVGQGELVDVDGELAVRIVSLGDQE